MVSPKKSPFEAIAEIREVINLEVECEGGDAITEYEQFLNNLKSIGYIVDWRKLSDNPAAYGIKLAKPLDSIKLSQETTEEIEQMISSPPQRCQCSFCRMMANAMNEFRARLVVY